MFKEFWERKKHVIEATAIFIAVGALFLAIPLPVDNQNARQALLNVQMAWLLITTFAVIILFLNFYVIVARIESRIDKKNYDVGATASLIVLILFTWILYFLWKYMVAIYSAPLKSLFLWFKNPIMLIDLAFSLFISRELVGLYKESKKIKYYMLSFFYSIINGVILGSIMSLLELKFDLADLFYYASCFSVLTYILVILYSLYNIYRRPTISKQNKLNI